MRVLYRVATLIGLRRVAAMRTIVRQRFTSWVRAPGVATPWPWTRLTQITSGMIIRNARGIGCRSTHGSIASAIPAPEPENIQSSAPAPCAKLQSLREEYKIEVRGYPCERFAATADSMNAQTFGFANLAV